MELRKCVFRKYLPPYTQVVAGNEVRFGGSYQQEFKTQGLFHQWGLDCLEDEQGFSNFTIAIVETSDGLIHKVDPTHIKFIS